VVCLPPTPQWTTHPVTKPVTQLDDDDTSITHKRFSKQRSEYLWINRVQRTNYYTTDKLSLQYYSSPPAVTALGSGVSVAAGASAVLTAPLAGAGTSAVSSSPSASSSSPFSSSSSSASSSSSSSSSASPLSSWSSASAVLRFFTGGSTE
jgi:hypothetical protein